MLKVLEWLGKMLIPIIVLSLMAWATWITTSIYAGDKGSAVSAEKLEAVSEKVQKIEEDVKDIKKDIKEQKEQIYKNQLATMQMLIDIKKNTQ